MSFTTFILLQVQRVHVHVTGEAQCHKVSQEDELSVPLFSCLMGFKMGVVTFPHLVGPCNKSLLKSSHWDTKSSLKG